MKTDHDQHGAPGSGLARRRGCTCPVTENQWGAGAIEDQRPSGAELIRSGYVAFWIVPDCELHGKEARADGDL